MKKFSLWHWMKYGKLRLHCKCLKKCCFLPYLEKRFRWTYFHGRNRCRHREWMWVGEGECGTNWEIKVDIYANVVQLLSRVWLFVTPWTAACQAWHLPEPKYSFKGRRHVQFLDSVNNISASSFQFSRNNLSYIKYSYYSIGKHLPVFISSHKNKIH